MSRTIAERRAALGMTRVALARAAGVHRETLRHVEAGDRRVYDHSIGRVLAALDRAEAERRKGGAA